MRQTFTSFYRAFFLVFIFNFLPVATVLSQSVNCPQCNSGICEGESLEDYISFAGYTDPISIISINGAATGSGSDLSGYTFIPGSSIEINFSDGSGGPYSETISVTVITVNAGFTYSPSGSVCSGTPISYSASNTYSGATYTWNFGDGQTASGSSVSHTYSNVGTGNQNFTVSLTITTPQGCTGTATQNITVLPQPNVGLFNGFDFTQCSGEATFDLTVFPSPTITGGTYTINWGDGSLVLSGSNPIGNVNHLYGQGVFILEYEVTGPNGCAILHTYTVSNITNPLVGAGLTTSTSACGPVEFCFDVNNFIDNHESTTYTVNFGDGSPTEFYNHPPPDELCHNYEVTSCDAPSSAFTYTITAENNCDISIATITPVRIYIAPEAELDGPEVACTNTSVSFENNSTPGTQAPSCSTTTTYEWDFGDGTTLTVFTEAPQSHTYSNSGNYTVTLTATNACGSPTDTHEICIEDAPIPEFNFNTTPDCAPAIITLDNLTPLLNDCETTFSWSIDFSEQSCTQDVNNAWSFSSGSDQNSPEPTINFNEPGTYIIELSASNTCGTFITQETITLGSPPVLSPQITGPFDTACEGDLICFDEWFCIEDCGNPLNGFELRLYDGFFANCPANPSATLVTTITNTLPSPPYDDCPPNGACTYSWIAVPGQYTLWIKAENDCGADYECITIDIPFPDIPVISGDDELCVDETGVLNASLAGGTFTFISCPSGCPTQGNNPGQYTVSGSTLTWETADGINAPGDYVIEYGGDCIGTGQFTVTVHPLPEFDITSDPSGNVCVGDEVVLNIDYLGTSSIASCSWVNEDTGTPISNPDCEVTVNPSPGVNTYSVTVTDINGCEAEQSIEIEELTQPFTMDCSVVNAAYCNNTGASIDLTDLLDPYPTTGTISWFLDNNLIVGTTLNMDGLPEGPHSITWTWNHPSPPNCLFEGECTFDITPPSVPVLTTDLAFCLGEEVNVSAAVPGGIVGDWTLITCPGICPTDATSTNFTWSWATDVSDIPGVYTLTYGGDCLTTETISFTLNPLPAFTIDASTTGFVCEGDEVMLEINYTGSGSVQSCEWVNEDTGLTISNPDCEVTVDPSPGGNEYSVTVVDLNGCASQQSIEIEELTQPFTLDCSAVNSAYCNNTGATVDLTDLLTPYPSSGTIAWFLDGNPNGTVLNMDGLPEGPHSITWTWNHPSPPNCLFEGECTFDITPSSVPVLISDLAFCLGEEVNVSAVLPGGIVGDWTLSSCPGTCPTDAIASDFTWVWNTDVSDLPGVYTLSYSGDCITTETISFTLNPLPAFVIDANNNGTICEGDEVILNIDYTGTGAVQCSWINENTGATISDPACQVSVFPTDLTTAFSVEVTDDNGCIQSDDIEIDIQTIPFSFDCSSIESSYCDNEVVFIDLDDLVDVDPDITGLEWYLNDVLVVGTVIDVEALDTSADPYIIHFEFTSPTAPNCFFENECSFMVTGLTTPNILSNSPVCIGADVSVELSGNNGLEGVWTFTDCPGGTCPTGYVESPTSLDWQTDAFTPPGDYTLTYTGDCLMDVSTVITINPLPAITITADPGAVLCDGGDVTLDVDYSGPGVLDCSWENTTTGEAIPSVGCDITVLPEALSETFTVTVIDENSCANTATIDIQIQEQPFTFECPDTLSYCDNQAVVIEFADLVSIDPSSPGFVWYLDGSPIGSISLDLEPLDASDTPYVLSFEYTHPDGPFCLFENECAFIISELTLPIIDSNSPVCLGDQINLELSGNNGFIGEWTFTNCPGGDCPDDAVLTDFTLDWQTDLDTPPGDYTVSYTGNCLTDVSTVITINPLPAITITADPGAVLCDGGDVTLDVDYSGPGVLDCSWENTTTGEAIPSVGCDITVLPTALTETFTVEVIDENNCENSAFIDIEIQEQPFTFECPDTLSYCDNQAVVIDFADLVSIDPSSPGFVWYLDGSPIGSISLDLEPLDASDTPYVLSFEYTHPDGPSCLFEGECAFIISELTLPTIDSNSPICLGGQINMELTGNNGFTGQWTFTNCPGGDCPDDAVLTSTTLFWQTDLNDTPGVYTISYSGNCLVTVSQDITINPLPPFDIVSSLNATICVGDEIELSINYLGVDNITDCVWADADGVISSPDCQITVAPTAGTTIYYVTATDGNACSRQDSLTIDIQQQPFTFDCDVILPTYCDNEAVVIELGELVSIDPSAGFAWFLNGDPIAGTSLDLLPLDASPDDYVLSFVYMHPETPNCLFSDSCSFQITDLTMPMVDGDDGLCINGIAQLTSSGLGGFEGAWTFIDCPNGNCPTNFVSDPNELEWDTDIAQNDPGIYTVQYTGLCLDTAWFEIELFPLPDFNVLTDPGETVCAEDEITVTFDYLGASTVDECTLTDIDGNILPALGSPSCTWNLLPANLSGPYTATLSDDNACVNSQTFNIDIQLQPFDFTCILEDTYCDNSLDIISLNDQISVLPMNGTLEWFINDIPLGSDQLIIFDLDAGDYTVSYNYVHGEAPNCVFTNGCDITITELVRPTLSSQLAFCQGQTVVLTAEDLEGFEGQWTNISCPSPPCLPIGTDPLTYTWSSEGAPIGEYVFEYSGLCLQTETITIELLGIPTVSWTPEDDTPCLNECMPYGEDVLVNYDAFGWEYHVLNDTMPIAGGELCFDQIGNPESLDICLWAELYHTVQDTVFTCYVSDCDEINPVVSPGNYPTLPTQACPGVALVINVDYTLYDDCSFILNDSQVFDNCSSIDIPATPYGTFPYELALSYQGCADTLMGEVFIPEPPSAELNIDYDPCIGDVFAELINLSGDALEFDWNVRDIPGINYDFLMTDDNSMAPVPNPIPLSNLNLVTDSTFFVQVIVENFCESIFLEDTVNYISAPDIQIDIANTAGEVFCFPQDFYFEIGEFATHYIDSVQWTFESIYEYGNIEEVTYTNLQFPPPLLFENGGLPDTVYVNATAWNQCGFDQDSISFVLLPPTVYLEMPDYGPGVCPGGQIQIPAEIIEGDPFNGCDVTSNPLIPGLMSSCDLDQGIITVTIPESTPPGIYFIITSISGCGSSIDYTEIEVFATPDVDFDLPDNACTSTEIAFENQSVGAVSFAWNFGDPSSADNTSSLSYPVHTFQSPGIYEVTLTATSDSMCVGQAIKFIEIFGPDPTLSLTNEVACSGVPVTTSFPAQDGLFSFEWEFLLPGIDTLIYVEENSIEQLFFNDTEAPQFWEVTLRLEDIYGCEAEGNAQVIVLPNPTAYFVVGNYEGCAQGSEVQFTNLSSTDASSKWVFDDPQSETSNISYSRNPTHVFSGPGDYSINLFVQNSFGCKDDFTRRLGCDDLIVYVPNAFTPDGNNLNEIFKPVIYGIEDISFYEGDYYTFQVYDRWGKLMFETNDPQKGWNGSSPNEEYYMGPDVFIWKLIIVFDDGSRDWTGHVTLVR